MEEKPCFCEQTVEELEYMFEFFVWSSNRYELIHETFKKYMNNEESDDPDREVVPSSRRITEDINEEDPFRDDLKDDEVNITPISTPKKRKRQK